MKKLLTVCMMLAALSMIAFAGQDYKVFNPKTASQYDIAARIEQLVAEVERMQMTGEDQTEIRAEVEMLRNFYEPTLTRDGSSLDLACADCAPAHLDLGTIGSTVYGYFVTSNLGTDGKWVASFNAVLGGVYYWDLCPTAPGTGTNSGFDPDIRIKNSACAQVAYVDGSCSAPSYSPQNYSWVATATGTFYVEIKKYGDGASGCTGTAANTFTLYYYATEPVPPPVNDQCAGALPLVVPGSNAGSTAFATDNYSIGAFGTGCTLVATGGKDVVYVYTPASTEAVTFSLCTATWDTKLYIATECPPTNFVYCDDDGCPTNSASYLECVTLTGGVTYYIFVDAYSSGSGAYDLVTSTCAAQARCCYTETDGSSGCQNVSADDCALLGGVFTATATCESAPCAEGQCCYAVGGDVCHPNCVAPVTPDYCATLGGVYTEGGDCSTPCVIDCYCSCSADANTHCALGPVAIVDLSCTTTPDELLIYVPIEYHITDVNVCFDITHAWDSDVDIFLVSPLGTQVELSTDNGSSGDNYHCTILDDESAGGSVTLGVAPFNGSYVPEFPLAGFDGENALGTWHLVACDDEGGIAGTINWACLTFTYDYILPVEFGSFDAVAGDNMITLNWSTASESNMSHFEVLRGANKVAEVSCTNSGTTHNYSFVDNDVTNGVAYTYTLVGVALDGTRGELGSVNASPNANGAVVTEYALLQNFPNPFNPETNIAFDMVEAGHVNVSIYNVIGQKVAELVNGNMNAGRHIVNFDATNLPSGLYLYKMEANGFSAQKKMVLMK
ncbi:T9SS type A sorting domain-containing protein [bacterium]|nr:T9SS type A sorting domain-containing protein [bacterium]